MFRSFSFIATATCLLLTQVLAMAHGHDGDSVSGACHGAHVHLFFNDCHGHGDHNLAEGMPGPAFTADADVLGAPDDHDDGALFLHSGALIRPGDEGNHAKLSGQHWLALAHPFPSQVEGRPASSVPDRGPGGGRWLAPLKCPIYILKKSIVV